MDHLKEERESRRFDKLRMSTVIYGDYRTLQLSRKVSQAVSEDPQFSREDHAYVSREELFDSSLKRSSRVIQKILESVSSEHGVSEEEVWTLMRFADDPLPIGLSLGMFIPAIEGQGTPEQAEEWIPKAKSFSIIGCYAQTELGHGSNVQGLETIAEYLPLSQEFDIHSPTLTSTKWWPGGLGKTATHALVYARLKIHNVDHGIHAFIVPIRSLENHKPLPGVTVGDIGPKFGYNTMDNGLLRLNHMRIPRKNMLMKFSQVSPEGNFTRKGNPKLSYGAMVLVRANLVKDAAFALSKAVTIAVRYSAVRRQFGEEGKREQQILDYPTQQHRLFPLMAAAFAFHFLGRWMMTLYTSTLARFNESDFSSLPEVHACTSGLKALTTQTAADGIEECRRRCGGSGFLRASGLPDLYATYVPAVTFEGDNIVLFLQVARFLLKSAQSAVKSGQPVSGTVSYFNQWEELLTLSSPVSSAGDLLDSRFQVEALKVRSLKLTLSCADRLARSTDQAKSFQENSVSLVKAAMAHCQLIAVEKFSEEAGGSTPKGDGVGEHLKLLSDLYALSVMEQNLGDFLEVEYFSPEQAQLVRDQVQSLCRKLRGSAVQLVDAFEFSDHYLNSVIGRYDGDVYPHLYSSAWKEPLNREDVAPGMRYLERFLGGGEASVERLSKL